MKFKNYYIISYLIITLGGLSSSRRLTNTLPPLDKTIIDLELNTPSISIIYNPTMSHTDILLNIKYCGNIYNYINIIAINSILWVFRDTENNNV